MTVSELSIKIQKTPAEIVKYLMMQGIMATVNQLIDVETIKKVCAEFELEVLEEDLDAFVEQEIEKEEKKKALQNVDKKLLKPRAPVKYFNSKLILSIIPSLCPISHDIIKSFRTCSTCFNDSLNLIVSACIE